MLRFPSLPIPPAAFSLLPQKTLTVEFDARSKELVLVLAFCVRDKLLAALCPQ